MKKRGFTLIELLAVIIILGILMLIAIPSVTNYRNNSRKETYINTVNEIIKAASTLVNSGEIEVNDPNTTYYIPLDAIDLENGKAKSPYGDFDEAYVVVTYDGDDYDYYFVGKDSANKGMKEILSIDNISKDSITDVDDIDTNVAIEGTDKIIIFDDELNPGPSNNATSYSSGEPSTDKAASIIRKNTSSSLFLIPNTNISVFFGPSPKNYVWLNGERWRITSIHGNQLKLVGKPIESDSSKKYNDNTNSNQWRDSSLNSYLNGSYYNSLSADAKELIVAGNFDVGAVSPNENAYETYLSASSSKYNGYVGLISLYEFMYAADSPQCYSYTGIEYQESNSGCGIASRNWITITFSYMSWIINSSKISNADAIRINSYAYTHPVNFECSYFPSVFLSPNTKIISGSGTYQDPYTIGL